MVGLSNPGRMDGARGVSVCGFGVGVRPSTFVSPLTCLLVSAVLSEYSYGCVGLFLSGLSRIMVLH